MSTRDPCWDWQLWLAGDGGEWQRCFRRASSLIDSGRVRFVGHRADPYACYAGADVAVSVSVEDSLPNFLVEAQTLGLPVIATDFRGVGEGMRDGKTGYLIQAQDRDGFLAAIRELYLRPKLRRKMGQRARAFAAENCASERQASKMLVTLRNFYLVPYRPRENWI